jgi:hypothetical protein
VFGCGYRRIADQGCSATTLRRRRDEWITAGVADQLRRAVLVAYDQLFGLELEQLAVDGCITKAPAAARSPGPARPTGASRASSARSRWRRVASRWPWWLPSQSPRRWAAGGDPGRRGDRHRRDGRSLPGTLTVHLDAGYDDQPCRQILAERGMAGAIAARGCRHRSRWAAAG